QDPADNDPNIAWAKETYEALHPHLAVRQYLNNLPADDGRIARGLWGANYERLVGIKRRYDPANTFRLNHNIDPAWSEWGWAWGPPGRADLSRAPGAASHRREFPA